MFPGKEYLMKAQFFLPSVDGDLSEGKPPINVKFEIPYFTTSGIQVSSGDRAVYGNFAKFLNIIWIMSLLDDAYFLLKAPIGAFFKNTMLPCV